MWTMSDLLFEITESKTAGAIRWQKRALAAEAKLQLRAPMPNWEFQLDDRVRLELEYESPLNGSEGYVKDQVAFYGLLRGGQWGYMWVYAVAWTSGELMGQTTRYTGHWIRIVDQSGSDGETPDRE